MSDVQPEEIQPVSVQNTERTAEVLEEVSIGNSFLNC